MTQGSDDQAQAGTGAGAATAPAPTAAAAAAGAAGALTLGSILTIAGVILLFVFFAVGIVSLQYCFNAWDTESRRREQSRPRRGGGSTRGGGTRRTGARGVDPELLRSLPVTVYNKQGQQQNGGDAVVECAVCLAELQDGEEARFLPRCGHGFHAECVDTWLASHVTCPLCRLTVAKPADGVSSPPAPPSLALLPPVPPEPANYGTAGGAGSMAAAMVIEIPELAAVPTPTLTTPCDAAKSPGSARLRSIRRLWSFGRQGAGAGAGAGAGSSSCSCAGAGATASKGVDLEQGTS